MLTDMVGIRQKVGRLAAKLCAGWFVLALFAVACSDGSSRRDAGDAGGIDGGDCLHVVHNGVCGLNGLDVECLVDVHCCEGEYCTLEGRCLEEAVCAQECPGTCNSDGSCPIVCEIDDDCVDTQYCLDGLCEQPRCGVDGTCPLGFVPIEETLACEPVGNPCPNGLVQGECGLADQCVECIDSSDCAEGFCDSNGQCSTTFECGVGVQCLPHEKCTEERQCEKACFTNQHCPTDQHCSNDHYCRFERCQKGIGCPPGWVEIPGSLNCSLSDCTAAGYVEGMCGLSGYCIECITDDDCVRSECDLEGQCVVDANYQCQYDDDCPDERMYCSAFTCVLPCRSDVDCYYGTKCSNGICETNRCDAQGECPEGWRSVPESLGCFYDPCPPEGLITAGCGLSGTCVECMVDEHCLDGICDLNGTCVDFECSVDVPCQDAGTACVDGRCLKGCLQDSDCEAEELCLQGACHPARCDQYGRCPGFGWKGDPGTLGCIYAPCAGTDLLPGVCGARTQCVECLDDTDCEDDQLCTFFGSCRQLPACGPDTNKVCANYEVCVGDICYIACEDDFDCQYGAGVCLPERHCYFERCSRTGECPVGWVPGTDATAPGSLICVPE